MFILISVVVVGIILYNVLNFEQTTHKIEPMAYNEVVEKLENKDYNGLNNYFNIEYDKPRIEKKIVDGTLKNILSYELRFKNITDKKLNLFVTLYYQNGQFASDFFEYDFDNIGNLKFLGERFIEVDVGKTYEVSLNLTIKDIENYSNIEKDYFYNNYGRFMGYFIVQDTEYKEYIECFNVN